jgi:hypothetical protein
VLVEVFAAAFAAIPVLVVNALHRMSKDPMPAPCEHAALFDDNPRRYVLEHLRLGSVVGRYLSILLENILVDAPCP